jgi:hypothetical protein
VVTTIASASAFGERLRNRGLSFGLPALPFLQKGNGIGTLGGIAEIVADDRFEHLADQVFHRAEADDDLGGVVARNVDDLAHIQFEGEAVRGPDLDGAQFFV